MSVRKTMIASMLLGACCFSVTAQMLNYEEFKNPSVEYRPRTWYHVNSSNMSKEGFTKDLEAIERAGLGGILVFNVSQGLPDGDVEYNSAEHRDILTHAAKECEKLGLSFGVHNCDGWTSSGGPWVTPEHSMKVVTSSEVIVDGGRYVDVTLPIPPTHSNLYQDIAVVAYPTLDYEIEDYEAKAKVTTSANCDITLAYDNNPETTARTEAGDWIQFDYGKPHTLRSLSVAVANRRGVLQLYKSQNGEDFTLVKSFNGERSGKILAYFYDNFEATTARYYRLVFERYHDIIDVKLSAGEHIYNKLDYISYAKRPRIGGGDIKDNMVIKSDDIVVLSDKMNSAGNLKATLPEGKWTIKRYGYTSSGAINDPASAAGTGLEIDKFSREALKIHYDAFVGRLVNEAKIDAPNAMQYAEIDSYEVGPQNWTDDLHKIFKERYGYDILPFLPLFDGKFVDNKDVIDDVFWDMKRLISDLMVENYFDYFTELCHEDGLVSYIEPYGFIGPFNSLDAGRNTDIPMAEFWAGKNTIYDKAPVSVAHIYGKKVISAEAFTSTIMNWGVHPALLKTDGDNEWTKGINEFMFHRFAHQSNTHVKPGMTMHFVGSHLDRTQTWWDNAGAAWFKYLARGSYMLRQGNAVVDLLAFVGDGAPTTNVTEQAFTPRIPKSYKYDCVNSDVIINRLKVVDGKLVLPEGAVYQALLMPQRDKITLETLRGIAKLSKDGALIIGKKPHILGGYIKTPEMQSEFAELVATIWSSERTYSTFDWESIFSSNGIEEDLIVEGMPDVAFNHRRTESEDIYFIYNNKADEAQVFECSFRVNGKAPELWNAMTGEVTRLVDYTYDGERTNLSIALNGSESVFVVFKESVAQQLHLNSLSSEVNAPRFYLDSNEAIVAEVAENGTYSYTIDGREKRFEVKKLPTPISVDGEWSIQFREEDFYDGHIVTNNLFEWQQHSAEDVKHYSGTAIYTTTFNVENGTVDGNRTFEIDLGVVHIAARVILNGQDLGVSWIHPFKLDVTQAIKDGANELCIEVTNQWNNRLIGDAKLPDQMNYTVRRDSCIIDGVVTKWSRVTKLGAKMPQWFIDNKPVPDGPRKTWSSFTFQSATDELQPSGLVGPVMINISEVKKLGNM